MNKSVESEIYNYRVINGSPKYFKTEEEANDYAKSESIKNSNKTYEVQKYLENPGKIREENDWLTRRYFIDGIAYNTDI